MERSRAQVVLNRLVPILGGQAKIAAILGASQGSVSNWINRSTAPDRDKLEAIESQLGIPRAWWKEAFVTSLHEGDFDSLRVKLRVPEGEAASPKLQQPARNPAALPADESPPRPLTSISDELKATIFSLDRQLKAGGLTPSQVAGLQGRRMQAIGLLSKCADQLPLEKHPDFEGFVEDTLTAIKDIFGPLAGPGAMAALAERLEALQLARTTLARPKKAA